VAGRTELVAALFLEAGGSGPFEPPRPDQGAPP
jgi:hypothetical protein